MGKIRTESTLTKETDELAYTAGLNTLIARVERHYEEEK